MMSPFTYSVEYYDECDHEMNTRHGLLYAENFVDATEQVVKYYGEQWVENLFLEGYEDGPIEVEKEVLTNFINARQNIF